MAIRFATLTVRELRDEEATLSHVLRTGVLPNSGVKLMMRDDEVRHRIREVRSMIGPRLVEAGR